MIIKSQLWQVRYTRTDNREYQFYVTDTDHQSAARQARAMLETTARITGVVCVGERWKQDRDAELRNKINSKSAVV